MDSAPRETTRARFQSASKQVGDTIGGNTEDISDFASRSRLRNSIMSRRGAFPSTRHAAFARLSRQNHSPQSQPTDNSPSSIPSAPSPSASLPNTTSTQLLAVASSSIDSIHLLSVAAPVANKTFVSTSASGLTVSGSDGTTTRAPANAEEARPYRINAGRPTLIIIMFVDIISSDSTTARAATRGSIENNSYKFPTKFLQNCRNRPITDNK